MKKLFTLIAMCLLGVGAMQADGWSYDFFNYCTTPSTGTGNVSENNTISPTCTTEGSFKANGTTFYNVTTPNLSTNFGISGTVSDNAVTPVFKLSNAFSSNYTISGQRIGLYAPSKTRMGIKNLTKGQTITIEASGDVAPTVEGTTPLVSLTSVIASAKTNVKFGDKTNRVVYYKKYVYTVSEAGTQTFYFVGGNVIYSVKVEDATTPTSLQYITNNKWDFTNLPMPYADYSSESTDNLWEADGSTLQYRGKNTEAELQYYATAAAKTAGTKTVYSPMEGLYFTATKGDGSDLRLTTTGVLLYRTNVIIKIKNLKKGQRLTVVSVGGGDDRYPSVKTNLTTVGSWVVSNAKTEQRYVATVNADGDIEFGAIDKSNFTIKSITVETPEYGLTVANINWASLYLPFDATIPTGMKAYYASVATNNNVTLTEITDAIPANTGVVVNATEGNYVLNSTTATTAVTGNLFSGVTTATDFDNSTIYVLAGSEKNSKGEFVPYFQLYADDTAGATNISLAAYKAYLPASKVPSAAKGGVINFVFDGGATAINAVSSSKVQVPGTRKAMVNGKFVIVKNGKQYNAAGAQIK